MTLGRRQIRDLKEALPVGTKITIVRKNGEAIHDHVNDSGFEIGIHNKMEICYYSPKTMRHHGAIIFTHYDTMAISKTNIKLDDCIIAIKKRGKEL